MRIFQFFYPILKPYKWYYLLIFHIPPIQALFHILNSYSLKLIVNIPYTKGDIWDYVYPVIILVGFAAFQELVCRIAQWAFTKSQPFIRGEIITKTYEYVQELSTEYFQNTKTGSISSKIKGIVDGYNHIFEFVWWKITNPVALCILGILSISFINISLSILVLFWCIIFVFTGFKMSVNLSKLSKVTNDAKHRTIGSISDNISNIFTIFSFGSKKYELNKIRNLATVEVSNLDYNKNLYSLKFNITISIITILMITSIFAYTIMLNYEGKITTGDFAYVVTLVYQIIHEIWFLADQIGKFFDTLGDFKSSFSILQMPKYDLDKKDARELII